MVCEIVLACVLLSGLQGLSDCKQIRLAETRPFGSQGFPNYRRAELGLARLSLPVRQKTVREKGLRAGGGRFGLRDRVVRSLCETFDPCRHLAWEWLKRMGLWDYRQRADATTKGKSQCLRTTRFGFSTTGAGRWNDFEECLWKASSPTESGASGMRPYSTRM